MVKFPEPPPVAALRTTAPDIAEVPPGTALARVFFRGGAHPAAWNGFRYWGPGSGRFDPHCPDRSGRPTLGPRGILYAAGAAGPGGLAVCLAEVFQETRIVDTDDRTPWFVVFRITRRLRLLDLRGLWPTRAGASAAIATGSKARARRWSRTIYDAWPDLHGLVYPSSMAGGGTAYALFERAQPALPATPAFHRALADPALAGPLLAAAGAIDYAVT